MQRSDVSLLGSLVMSILIFLSSAGAEPVLLTEEVANFAVLNDTEVIYCDMDANFFIVDIDAPDEARPWDPHWDPTAMGWGGATTLVYLCASPDGEWVCFAQFLEIPEDATGDAEFVPWPLAVVISPVHGEAAWFAALAMEVGGGPDFDFTMDSMNLYGQPFVPSETSLEDYLAWFRGDIRRERIEEFTRINLLSGERTGGDIFLGDGYLACPYSDLIAADDMMIGMIVDMSTEEFLFQEDTGEFEFLIDKWVLEDAILVHFDGIQNLLYSNGNMVENPGEADIDVYCWMPGGEYLFSTDDGESIQYGNINWDTFTSADAVTISDTSLQLTKWNRVLPMADGSGIVFDSYELGGLVFFPVPGI
jgi:hypothetical protein